MILKRTAKVPHKPGVYIMHDKNDEIIYVGKAIDLRRRVGQYFDSSKTRKGRCNGKPRRVFRVYYRK